MVTLAAIPRWTVDQYLDLERSSTVRHEYLDGYVYALAGGTQAHSVITVNVATLLRQAMRGGPCRVYSSDMKVRVARRRFFYPDISVGCEPADRRDDADWIAAPRVVVEVLSDSTAAYDRGDKFARYRRITSLQDYVLIETDRRRVEVHSRQSQEMWPMRAYGADDTLAVPSLDIRLTVAAIYEDVDLPLA